MTSTILGDLAFLDAIVRRIGPDRAKHVSTIGAPSVFLVDAADGHEIASELNLTLDQTHAEFVTYSGDVEGHDLTLFASHREEPATEFEHVAFLDSDPTDEPGGASFARFPSTEAAAEHAKSAYGQVRWEQSGADEYAFTDRNGRRGYVIVRPYIAEKVSR